MRLAINAQAAPMQAVEGPAPATFLIVEDDPFLTMLIQRMLESAGHKVLSAGKTNKSPILTDLSMPLMDGHELIRWIREVDSNLPIDAGIRFRDQQSNRFRRELNRTRPLTGGDSAVVK